MAEENEPAVAGVAQDASTLTDVLAGFEAEGFVGQLIARDGAEVECGECRTFTPAGSLTVSALRRLEGASDPSDMLAVAAATCPHCGTKGTIVLGYGPDASGADTDVLHALEEVAG